MDRLLAISAVVASRPVRELAPPRWARELVGEHFAILTARVLDVPDLSPRRFEQQTFIVGSGPPSCTHSGKTCIAKIVQLAK